MSVQPQRRLARLPHKHTALSASAVAHEACAAAASKFGYQVAEATLLSTLYSARTTCQSRRKGGGEEGGGGGGRVAVPRRAGDSTPAVPCVQRSGHLALPLCSKPHARLQSATSSQGNGLV